MFKLIKYELKDYSKNFLMITSCLVFITILMSFFLNTKVSTPANKTLVFGFINIIGICSYIVVFILNVRIFSKALCDDSRYLLFTLPQNGYSILGSKLLTSLIAFLSISILYSIFIFFMFFSLDKDLMQVLYLIKLNFNVLTLFSLGITFAYMFSLLIIYFSNSLSKVAIKNRTFGKVTTLVFIIASIIILINLSMFFYNVIDIPYKINMVIKESRTPIEYLAHSETINISPIIFNILAFIGMFFGTSYILENKINL
jgi:ABC-2 type transport system permease protein